MARTVTIWITGLLASMTTGAAVGCLLNPYGDQFVFGWIGGAAGFTCLRLWLAEARGRPAQQS